MTEKEKEVLETLKILVDKKYGSTSVIERNDLKTLLNLIEKQNRTIDHDIEDLSKSYHNLFKMLIELKEDYIPKYKVIGFIKRLEKDAQNIREKKKDSNDYDRSSSRIQAYLTKTNEIIERLKELLEED